MPTKQQNPSLGMQFAASSDNVAVFATPESWTVYRRLKKGEVVHAAGPAKKVGKHQMQPIVPEGAVQTDFLRPVRHDSKRAEFVTGHFTVSKHWNLPLAKVTCKDTGFWKGSLSKLLHIEGSITIRDIRVNLSPWIDKDTRAKALHTVCVRWEAEAERGSPLSQFEVGEFFEAEWKKFTRGSCNSVEDRKVSTDSESNPTEISARRWTAYWDNHPELQTADRATMQEAYTRLQESCGEPTSGKVSFSRVAHLLRATGRQEYGTWEDSGGKPPSISQKNDAQVAAALAQYIAKCGGFLQASSVSSFYEKDASFREVGWRRIIAGGRKLRQFCDEHPFWLRFSLEGGPPGTIFAAQSSNEDRAHDITSAGVAGANVKDAEVAAKLLQYIEGRGGSISAEGMTEYYKEHPTHKKIEVTHGGRTLREFCEEHPDAFKYEFKAGQTATISSTRVPKHVCTGPGRKAAGGSLEPELEALRCRLVALLKEAGGRILGSVLGKLYIENPSWRAAVNEVGGMKGMCKRFGGMHVSVSSSSTAEIVLEGAEGARAALDDGASSDTVRTSTARPESSELDDAASNDESSVNDDAFTAYRHEMRLLVDNIWWSHDTITVRFTDGRLLVDTLRQLLDGELEVDELPPFDVWEHEGQWHAITGNRRLWVLKEFSKARTTRLHVRVNRLDPQSAPCEGKAKRMWATRTQGKSVQFVVQRRDKAHFPCMAFALAEAGLREGGGPSPVDMLLGGAIQAAGGSIGMPELGSALHWGTAATAAMGKLGRYPILRAGPISLMCWMAPMGA
ncbi:unnamed protein product [Prorocentrum cordatum]|uniref:Uncharacterized protein n=1 Tax=Prorocentrum cordatum TaxID=2364126 RepID=A0ABN9VKD6_9DINO|nr:unnamed protein product [Polarella glacialis]